jgi:hypothetical protein
MQYISVLLGMCILVAVIVFYRFKDNNENKDLKNIHKKAEFDINDETSIQSSLQKALIPISLSNDKEPDDCSDIFSRFISDIIYINLDKSVDRKRNIESEINSIFSKNDNINFFRFPAIKCEYNGALGCLMSHVAILRKYVEKNCQKNILILEDDFKFIISNRKDMANRLLLIESNMKQNWDVIQFGGYCVDWAKFIDCNGEDIKIQENDISVNLMKLYKATTTSGYLVNKNFIERLYNTWNDHLKKVQYKKTFSSHDHLDQVQINLQEYSLWLGFSKPIGIQREGWSEIEQKPMNNAWTYIGSLNEFINYKQQRQKINLRNDYKITENY